LKKGSVYLTSVIADFIKL